MKMRVPQRSFETSFWKNTSGRGAGYAVLYSVTSMLSVKLTLKNINKNSIINSKFKFEKS